MNPAPYVYNAAVSNKILVHICYLLVPDLTINVDSYYDILVAHIIKSTPWLTYLNFAKQTSLNTLKHICTNYSKY